MTNLETRLNLTAKELETIRETLLKLQDLNMEKDLSITYLEMFKIVLNDSQFKACESNAMTRALCLDLFKF